MPEDHLSLDNECNSSFGDSLSASSLMFKGVQFSCELNIVCVFNNSKIQGEDFGQLNIIKPPMALLAVLFRAVIMADFESN